MVPKYADFEHQRTCQVNRMIN